MENIDKVFNRQFERLKNELLAINMPQGYLTIVSKYWEFCRIDVEDIVEGITGNAIQECDENNH